MGGDAQTLYRHARVSLAKRCRFYKLAAVPPACAVYNLTALRYFTRRYSDFVFQWTLSLTLFCICEGFTFTLIITLLLI